MSLHKYRLGELIELLEHTNSDLHYGVDDVRGVNNLKRLMPTKADVNERDLSKFQIVKPGEFVFNHRMVANQQAYERGLEDLKLTCDAYIENLRRRIPCERIGRYITECNAKNDIGLTLDFVRGISTDKEFIDTKANMDGVSLSNYKIVSPNEIAFISDTSRRGDKISLAINSSKETYLVSSISTVFRTNSDHLIPQYLFLFFLRSEFNRYSRFHSWGSARETFDWDAMCDVQIPIPDIEIQKSIAEMYTVYNKRKKINEQLKAQIKNICPILIRGSLEDGGEPNGEPA